ncbi:IS1595 family transposase [Mucilaginibacter sp.]|uniref:IS1595 family transposase n=1 Tax=Mucilaginibacter sp. TaxID=1882438 RepID=UPI003B002EB8
MTTNFKSLLQVLDFFKEEKTCIDYLAQQRWGATPSCPHCGNVSAYTTNRGYKCKAKECGKKFTVITGTTFENTKISLRLWFAAMYLCTAHKKGISSLQLSRDLNITQKTAWFLLHRIREMLAINNSEPLTGTVEVDETYVGGKKINKHKSVRAKLKDGTGYVNKTPIVAMLQRDGNIVTVVSPIANGETIKPFIYKHVAPGSTVITDGFGAYKGLDKTYTHEVVNHHQNEYVSEKGFHTNTIEGFWSQLKRGIIGIYHQVSPKHLHRYAHEFGYKYNTRKQLDTFRFSETVKLCNKKRLTYAQLIK